MAGFSSHVRYISPDWRAQGQGPRPLSEQNPKPCVVRGSVRTGPCRLVLKSGVGPARYEGPEGLFILRAQRQGLWVSLPSPPTHSSFPGSSPSKPGWSMFWFNQEGCSLWPSYYPSSPVLPSGFPSAFDLLYNLWAGYLPFQV